MKGELDSLALILQYDCISFKIHSNTESSTTINVQRMKILYVRNHSLFAIVALLLVQGVNTTRFTVGLA